MLAGAATRLQNWIQLGGLVWHTAVPPSRPYLKQRRDTANQALLVRKHPEYFNAFGGSMWHGRIYTASKHQIVVRSPIIYHGVFGSGWFSDFVYLATGGIAVVFSSLEYLLTVPLFVLSPTFHLMYPLAVTSLGLSLGVCIAAGAKELLPGPCRWWSRPVVALLFFCLSSGARPVMGAVGFAARAAGGRGNAGFGGLAQQPCSLEVVTGATKAWTG